MIRFNVRTKKYEAIIDGFVYSFTSLQEAMQFVASARAR